jgi:uncharacterized protein YecT (DUF1311 family)
MKSIFSLVLLLFVMFSGHSGAQDDTTHNEGFCQSAQTTADLVACTSQRLDAENTYLKTLYDKLAAFYKDDQEILSGFNDRQNDWLNYRTQTCDVEASYYEGGSLERVQKISCQARMAADRSKHFKAVLTALDDNDIPTFSSPPRWVNVVLKDYGDIFWSFADRSQIDLDCDGIDEFLINGLRPTESGDYMKVTAIADSDATGRPVITLLNFDDQKNCDIDPDILIKPIPSTKPDEHSNDNLQCQKNITLKTKQCGDFSLSLDLGNGSYTVSPLNGKEDGKENE